MKNKIPILTLIIIIGIIFSITTIIPGYLHSQSNDVLTINYVCTTGLKPYAFSAFKSYDNGTHTINMDSCGWISNTFRNTANGEYQDIASMTCEEIKERNNLKRPYQNNENRIFVQARIDICNFQHHKNP